MKTVCVLLLGVVLCACSKEDNALKPVPVATTSAVPDKVAVTNAPVVKELSTLETAVDGITGRTSVNAGRKAQDKIRSVVRDRDADMKEVDSFGR